MLSRSHGIEVQNTMKKKNAKTIANSIDYIELFMGCKA